MSGLLFCRAACVLPPPLACFLLASLFFWCYMRVFFKVCWHWMSRAQIRVKSTYPNSFPVLVTVWFVWPWEEGWVIFLREEVWVLGAPKRTLSDEPSSPARSAPGSVCSCLSCWRVNTDLVVWWSKRFDPCHHDRLSAWLTVHIVPRAGSPEILPTFTKAFLECSHQASLFTLLILPCICIFSIR